MMRSAQYPVLFKVVFPPAVSESLEDIRNGAWRTTVYGITQPKDISGKRWLYKKPLRCLDKHIGRYRVTARGVLKIGEEKMHADTAGFSKPQSFSLATCTMKPRPFGTNARDIDRREVLSGFWMPWEPVCKDPLKAKNVRIHSISSCDLGSYARQYYFPSKRMAESSFKEKVGDGDFFHSLGELEWSWQSGGVSDLEHNEVLARARWMLDKKHALVCFSPHSIAARLLTLIRKHDFFKRIINWKKKDDTVIPRDYDIPLKFYSVDECTDYTLAMQNKDFEQAIDSIDPLVQRLLLFYTIQKNNFHVTKEQQEECFKNIKWLLSIAESLTYESSELFYSNFIRVHWCALIKSNCEKKIEDRVAIYINIFNCVHPENLYSIYMGFATGKEKLVDNQSTRSEVLISIFYVLHAAGYTMPVVDFIKMVRLAPAEHQYAIYIQRCRNQYLLKAMKARDFDQAEQLIALGAKADYFKWAPNEVLSLGLAVKSGRMDLAERMLDDKGVGIEELSQAAYFLIRDKYSSSDRLLQKIGLSSKYQYSYAVKYAMKVRDEQFLVEYFSSTAVSAYHSHELSSIFLCALYYDLQVLIECFLEKKYIDDLLPVIVFTLASQQLHFQLKILLCARYIDVNRYRDPQFGWSALHFAVNSRYYRIVALLCKAGADISCYANYKGTPVDIAVSFNDERLLMSIFSNINWARYLTNHTVSFTKLLEKLIGFPLSVCDLIGIFKIIQTYKVALPFAVKKQVQSKKNLLLFDFVESKRYQEAEELLLLGAESKCFQSSNGVQSAVLMALGAGELELAIKIYNNAVIKDSYEQCYVAYLLSVVSHIDEAVRQHFFPDNQQYLDRALFFAVFDGRLDKALALLASGARVTKAGFYFETNNVLLLSIERGYDELLQVILSQERYVDVGILSVAVLYMGMKNKTKYLSHMLNYEGVNVDLNFCTGNAWNALFYAIDFENIFAIELLCQYGADINFVDNAGQSIIEALIQKNNKFLMIALYKNIIDLSLVVKDKRYLLITACVHFEIDLSINSSFTLELKRELFYEACHRCNLQLMDLMISCEDKLLLGDDLQDYDRFCDSLILGKKFIFNAFQKNFPDRWNDLQSNDTFINTYLKKINSYYENLKNPKLEELGCLQYVLPTRDHVVQYHQCLLSLIARALSLKLYKLSRNMISAFLLKSPYQPAILCIIDTIELFDSVDRLAAFANIMITHFKPQHCTVSNIQPILACCIKDLNDDVGDINKHRGYKQVVIAMSIVALSILTGVCLSGAILAVPFLLGVKSLLGVAGTGVAAGATALGVQCGLFSTYNYICNKKFTVRPMTNSSIKLSKEKHKLKSLVC